jgi:hypothetical protein
MLEFYYAVILAILNVAVPYLITRRDRRRLTKDELDRAWNTATWGSAVYFFGPLCLPVHFWVTRRSLWGLFQGGAWTIAVFSCEWLIGVAMGIPSD